ncbi:Armadillo-type fold [Cynara cardunculus var. scolymus]|uniref:Armadillo-type fold n=1 Tax=Cynara cardunculus var. scolymus TaxID=59895 RepID=A0A118K5M2_CYNCS|nr:Armadillo-type fold [Cynara cardunculus var. scolymus]
MGEARGVLLGFGGGVYFQALARSHLDFIFGVLDADFVMKPTCDGFQEHVKHSTPRAISFGLG